jgi:hypothetical protein
MIALMTVWDVLLDHLDQLILTIIGVVIGGLLIEHYSLSRRSPKIIIEPLQREDKLGFSVSLKKGQIKDARVRCNTIPYSWENIETKYPWDSWKNKDDKVKSVERKDLCVGDEPSSFFPLQVNLEYKKDLYKFLKENYPNQEFPETKEPIDGMNITVQQLKTPWIFSFHYPFPKEFTINKDLFSHQQFLINAEIRIIGEGIDEIIDYPEKFFIELSNMNLAAIRSGAPPKEELHYFFKMKKRRSILQRIFKPETETI